MLFVYLLFFLVKIVEATTGVLMIAAYHEISSVMAAMIVGMALMRSSVQSARKLPNGVSIFASLY